MTTVAARGTTLAYDRSGTGEPLVLVHGYGSRRAVWDPLLPYLEPDRDVIRVDLPGFGDSPPLPRGERPTPPRLAEEVARFIADLGLGRPHVAGNSMGGWIALELSKAGRVRSACALSPAGFWNRWEREFCKASFRALKLSLSLLGDRLETYTASPAVRRAGFRQYFEHADRMTAEEAVASARNVLDTPGFDLTFGPLHEHHFTGGAAVRPPATIAWAEHDRLLLPRQAARARAAIPQARHVWLHGCGHVPTYDDPALVARTILSSG